VQFINYKLSISQFAAVYALFEYTYIFYSPHYSGRQNIETINTSKQTNEQIEKHMNGSE